MQGKANLLKRNFYAISYALMCQKLSMFHEINKVLFYFLFLCSLFLKINNSRFSQNSSTFFSRLYSIQLYAHFYWTINRFSYLHHHKFPFCYLLLFSQFILVNVPWNIFSSIFLVFFFLFSRWTRKKFSYANIHSRTLKIFLYWSNFLHEIFFMMKRNEFHELIIWMSNEWNLKLK